MKNKSSNKNLHSAKTNKNNLLKMEFPKLTVVTVQEILDGVRLNIPVLEVVKKAEHKGKANIHQMAINEFVEIK
ncbi:MAG: hypothetical protein AABZ32_04855 [Bacteroidota bacterium]